MVLQIIIYLALFMAGTFYSSLGIIGPMICVNFALPTTKKLTDSGWFTNAAIVRKKYRSPVILWGIINAIVFLAFFSFVPMKFAIAFFAGCGWSTLIALGKSGANQANVNEYVSAVLPFSRVKTDEELQEMISVILRK